MSSSRFPLWVLGSIVVLPPLVISSYLSLSHYKASQLELAPYKPTYTVLSLPELETMKLPLRAQELSLTGLKETPKKVNSIESFRGTSASKSKEVTESTASEQKQLLDIDDLDLSGLSPELAARFESILSEPSEYEIEENPESIESDGYLQLEKSGSQLVGRLPALNFQTHNYTSKPSRRWIKVNGKEVNVGGSITPSISLLEINPRNVVIEFKGQKIEIPALYEWKG